MDFDLTSVAAFVKSYIEKKGITYSQMYSAYDLISVWEGTEMSSSSSSSDSGDHSPHDDDSLVEMGRALLAQRLVTAVTSLSNESVTTRRKLLFSLLILIGIKKSEILQFATIPANAPAPAPGLADLAPVPADLAPVPAPVPGADAFADAVNVPRSAKFK